MCIYIYIDITLNVVQYISYVYYVYVCMHATMHVCIIYIYTYYT